MKICFPVQNDAGIESIMYDHFGSAPVFVVVDTDSGTLTSITNNDLDHVHGACNPLKALGGHPVDGIVVGGIGAGSLGILNKTGVRVFKSQADTVKENIACFEAKELTEFATRHACGGHADGKSCCH